MTVDPKNLGYQNLGLVEDSYSMDEFLQMCQEDHLCYASAYERLLAAIGEPEVIDTSKDPKLSRIFSNQIIHRYKPFSDLFGIEEALMQLVKTIKHAAMGLEESKQVLYLLGPVGSGKSTVAERLKDLMEMHPIYVAAAEVRNQVTGKWELMPSPVYEHPFGVIDPAQGKVFEDAYGIPARYVQNIPSPWLKKRLVEDHPDYDKMDFMQRVRVVKMSPSKLAQIGVMKVEPGDDNNQDISTLVGRANLAEIEFYSSNDPDAYSFSGGLNRATQGMMEFVEMFKAPIKTLHPLLTATQEKNYTGVEDVGAIPFQGIILAHSNESEWGQFRSNKSNEAFLDRVCLVRFPYTLRASDEEKIYQNYINRTELKDAPCVPETLKLLSQFSVLTRLEKPEKVDLFAKLRVYDGYPVKDSDPKAKELQELKGGASITEGFSGTSTRFAFKVLDSTFTFDHEEIAADPVHLFYVLEEEIKREQLPAQTEAEYIAYIKEYLAPWYYDQVSKVIREAYLESYDEYGQNMFDRYIAWVDAWIQEADWRDPDTGQTLDRKELEDELAKIEIGAGIGNVKDFRNEVNNFALRYRANNEGNNPHWKSYEKMREVIEARMFTSMEDILPVISFEGNKKDSDTQKKHEGFVSRMKDMGYTVQQTKRLVTWYLRARKSQ